MRRTLPVALFLATSMLFTAPLLAQQYSGTFTVANDVGGVMTLLLRQAGDGTVTGVLSSDGVTYQIEGRLQDGLLVGVMISSEGKLFFDAERSQEELWVTLYGPDAQGQPNYDDYTEIDFVAQDASASGGFTPDPRQPRGNPFAAEAQRPGGGNPLAAGANDPYVGTFTDGNVTLRLQGVGGQYQGQVALGGQLFPVSASGGPSGLQGVIQTQDGSYPMTIQAVNGGLIVVSGGQQYELYPEYSTAAQGGGFGRSYGSQQPLGVGQRAQPGARPGISGQQPTAGVNRSDTGRELAPGFTESHPLAQQWVQFLSGNKLTRMSSYSSGSSGGYSARTDVYLCSDRTFAMRDESSVSVDVGGAFGNSGGVDRIRGQWYVITNGQAVGLILESSNGETLEFRMEYQNEETYANGERVFVTPSDLCR